MNIEWLNTNRYRSYPFREDSVFQGLPSWCLVDFYLVDTIDDGFNGNVTLVKAENSSGNIKLTMAYRSTEFTITTSSSYATGTVEVQYSQPAGQHKPIAHYVTGYGDDILSSTITFTNPPVILPTRIIRKPGGSGVSSLSVTVSGSETNATGRVHLDVGCNCSLRIYADAVNADVGAGEGAGKCCQQTADDGCSSKLLFLNGQTADSDGNISLSGASGIMVYPGETMVYNVPNLGIVTLPTVIIASTDLIK